MSVLNPSFGFAIQVEPLGQSSMAGTTAVNVGCSGPSRKGARQGPKSSANVPRRCFATGASPRSQSQPTERQRAVSTLDSIRTNQIPTGATPPKSQVPCKFNGCAPPGAWALPKRHDRRAARDRLYGIRNRTFGRKERQKGDRFRMERERKRGRNGVVLVKKLANRTVVNRSCVGMLTRTMRVVDSGMAMTVATTKACPRSGRRAFGVTM